MARSKRRWYRRPWIWVLFAILLLGSGARIWAPYYLKHRINEKIAETKDFDGHVKRLDLDVILGGYHVDGLVIRATNESVSLTSFESPRIDIRLEYRELLHGRLVTRVVIHDPKVVLTSWTKKKQNPFHELTLGKRLEKMIPFTFDSLVLEDGTLDYRLARVSPKANLEISDWNAKIRNLSTRPGLGTNRWATVDTTGVVNESGQLDAHVRFVPFEKTPTFHLEGHLRAISLPSLNDFLLAYSKVRTEGGTFSVYVKAAGEDGAYKGIVEPVMKDAKIVPQPGKQGPVGVLENALAGLLQQLFENHATGTNATEVPFHGRFEPHVDIFTAIVDVLRNAFVHALPAPPKKEIHVGSPPQGRLEAAPAPPAAWIHAVAPPQSRLS